MLAKIFITKSPMEFTEEHLTDLDPGEPTICVTATVTVKDWEIVPVEPEYGK